MKIIFITTLFSPFLLISQTGPGGVGNATSNVLWLPVQNGTYIDAGSTNGTNGSSIQQWNDISGGAKHATQLTAAYKPILYTNQVNGFSSLRFDGSDDRMLSTNLNSGSQATMFVVVRFNSFSNSNDGVFQGSPTGSGFSTVGTDKSVGMWINTSNANIWGRGTQSNNVSINIPQTSALSTGQFHILTQQYGGGTINQYVNGSTAGNIVYNNTLRSWADFGIGRQGVETVNGDIAEVIAYNIKLNSAQRIINENALSAKYGLALSTNDLFDEDNVGNGNYDFDVAGIGRVDAANIHSDAQGRSMVRILNPSNLDNNEFMIWGHNNELAQAAELSDVPTGVMSRLARVWRVSEVSLSAVPVDVGSVDIRWDLSGLGAVTASDLRLLIDTNNDGVFANDTPIGGATSLGGGIYEFSGVSAIENNLRFTIGTINSYQTPLPVELSSFEVKNEKNKTITISWETLTERNCDYFLVERSKDGSNWELVSKTNTSGNSSSLKSYLSTDFSPYEGISYYRLKQVDLNGEFEYSDIRLIERKFNQKTDITIYPNPFEDELFITGFENESIDIHLYTLSGIEITERAILEKKEKATVHLIMDRLMKGTYILNVNNNNYKLYKN